MVCVTSAKPVLPTHINNNNKGKKLFSCFCRILIFRYRYFCMYIWLEQRSLDLEKSSTQYMRILIWTINHALCDDRGFSYICLYMYSVHEMRQPVKIYSCLVCSANNQKKSSERMKAPNEIARCQRTNQAHSTYECNGSKSKTIIIYSYCSYYCSIKLP